MRLTAARSILTFRTTVLSKSFGLSVLVPMDMSLSQVLERANFKGLLDYGDANPDVDVRVTYEGLWESYEYTIDEFNKFISQ